MARGGAIVRLRILAKAVLICLECLARCMAFGKHSSPFENQSSVTSRVLFQELPGKKDSEKTEA